VGMNDPTWKVSSLRIWKVSKTYPGQEQCTIINRVYRSTHGERVNHAGDIGVSQRVLQAEHALLLHPQSAKNQKSASVHGSVKRTRRTRFLSPIPFLLMPRLLVEPEIHIGSRPLLQPLHTQAFGVIIFGPSARTAGGAEASPSLNDLLIVDPKS
jgi:hypothetical protein